MLDVVASPGLLQGGSQETESAAEIPSGVIRVAVRPEERCHLVARVHPALGGEVQQNRLRFPGRKVNRPIAVSRARPTEELKLQPSHVTFDADPFDGLLTDAA